MTGREKIPGKFRIRSPTNISSGLRIFRPSCPVNLCLPRCYSFPSSFPCVEAVGRITTVPNKHHRIPIGGDLRFDDIPCMAVFSQALVAFHLLIAFFMLYFPIFSWDFLFCFPVLSLWNRGCHIFEEPVLVPNLLDLVNCSSLSKPL